MIIIIGILYFPVIIAICFLIMWLMGEDPNYRKEQYQILELWLDGKVEINDLRIHKRSR
jgi:hypothetical protein